MATNHDYQALNWVKGEIEDTLIQAQQELEAYSNEPRDRSRIRFCLNHLHQVNGTLQIVEFYGAALLAEEMEQLAQWMSERPLDECGDSINILLAASMQLPSYLDRVVEARRDMPLVLLPLLNDLRAARGESLLSESALFRPDLNSGESAIPREDVDEDIAEKLQGLLVNIRQLFQIALSGIIQDQDLPTNYANLSKSINKLEHIYSGAPLARLWWVSSALLDGLTEESIPLNAAVKTILGDLDQQLKSSIDTDAKRDAACPEELVTNILYYVAQAKSDAPRIVAVKDAFRLHEAIPEETDLEAERRHLSGPGREAMTNVSHALVDELGDVKERIDLFVRGGEKDLSVLGEVIAPLKKMSDTLGMLTLGGPRRVLNEQIETIEGVVASGRTADYNVLMDIAGGLIYVEATLQGLAEDSGVEQGQNVNPKVTDHVSDARSSVIAESRAGLENAKDAIVEYLSSGFKLSAVAVVPGLLQSVRGGLLMLPLERPANVLKCCNRFLDNQVIAKKERPSVQDLDTLADAITSVEYYLERLDMNGTSDAGILEIAEEAVAILGYPVDADDMDADDESQMADLREQAKSQIHDIDDSDESPFMGVPSLNEVKEADTAIRFSDDAGIDDFAPEELEAGVMAQADDTNFESDESSSDEQSSDVKPASVALTPDPMMGGELDMEDRDEELVEIFVEEAEEVMEAINEQFPNWRQTGSTDALADVRRAFHTLKGSGRMVGATDVGEVAWSVENMLNRLIDKLIQPGEDIFRTIEISMEICPVLVADFEAGRHSTVSSEYIIARATAIANGEAVPAEPSAAAAPVADEQPVVESPEATEQEAAHFEELEEAQEVSAETMLTYVPEDSEDFGFVDEQGETAESAGKEVDPVLLDIFSQEARNHLTVLKHFLEAGDTKITAPLLRAMHTLKGSAHMAGIVPIATLVSPAEKLVKECHLQGVEADPDIHLMLGDVVSLVERGLHQITKSVTAPIVGTSHFLEQVETLRTNKLTFQDDAALAEGAAADPAAIAQFMEAHADAVLDAPDKLSEWQKNPVPGAELDALAENVRVLSRSASAVNLPNVATLCMGLDEIYTSISSGLFTPNERFFEIANGAHEHLITMLDRVAAGQTPESGDEYINQLEALLDAESAASDASGDESDISTEEVVMDTGEGDDLVVDDVPEADDLDDLVPVMEVSSAPEAAISISEDYDPELVEIFLEEASEITDSLSDLLHNWMNDQGNTEKVVQLQRELHTLKGGARMSEITALGDLAHEIETLYEAMADGIVAVSPPLFDVLHKGHDRLAEMVECLREQRPIQPAEGLIHVFKEYMKTGKVVDLPEDKSAAPEATMEPVASGTAPVNAPTDSQVFTPEETEVREDTEALEQLSVQGEDLDTEILEVFLDEADELADNLDASIHAWLKEPESAEHRDEIKRLLHTLKGGARLAGLTKLGDISHDFETNLIETEDGTKALDDAFFADVHQQHDALFEQINLVRKHGSDLVKISREKEDESANNVVPITPQPSKIEAAALLESFTLDDAEIQDTTQSRKSDRGTASGETVRVTSELLEDLVNLAGESSIIRGRMETEISDFTFVIDEIGQTIDRLKEQLRRLDGETEAHILHRHQSDQEDNNGQDYEDFDPLEMDRYSTLNQLSRSLGESASDLIDLTDSLRDRARDTETLMLQQSRVNTELQEGLMRTRMVPFSRTVPRLRRIIRQIANEVNKKAELEIIGAEGEMDRTVLDRMVAPLEHMLRNAVDHGLETTEERIAKGKNEVGRITLHLAREGGDVVLRISDDGKGVDLEGVKKRAIERGLMADDAPLSDKEIMQFIFQAGFSTKDQVTQISGRGVGMDVVYSEIKQLGGSVKIHSAPNAGSQFTVRLPFTVSVNRALMVRVGEDAYAIPLNNIEGIVRVSPYELESYYEPDAPAFEYAGSGYSMRYLGGFVHGTRVPSLQGYSKPLPVLLVRGAEHTMALQVDSLIGSREIVVKSVGPQLSAVSGLSGATILGDGSVVIILDLVAMIRAEQAQLSVDANYQLPEQLPQEEVEKTPLVMVVDDSVTVRKVTSRLLERNGFDVATAKDGVDAITQLQEIKPDCMLLDIEMPRMDGFEVATLIRHDDRLKDTPIIMITSRTGEKHKERAMSIGVNDYMGKPYQETALLEAIQQFVKHMA